MPLDPGVYCGLEDLLLGDLTLPRYMGDGSQFVNIAAEDIDSSLGHIYVTPIEIVGSDPTYRASTLMLKRINRLLASGRIILDLAAAGEDSDLHAYGRSLYREGMDLLQKIVTGDIVLAGADRVDAGLDAASTGPRIINEDSASLVESFYARFDPTICYPLNQPQVHPYG